MTKLHKISAPGWIKEYDNDIDLKAELYSHICGACRDGESYTEEDAGGNTIVYWDSVNENSDIGDMLNTPCGCEYAVEEADEKEDNG